MQKLDQSFQIKFDSIWSFLFDEIITRLKISGYSQIQNVKFHSN